MEINSIHKTNNSGKLKIVSNINSTEAEVEFLETGYKRRANVANIRKGKVADPSKTNSMVGKVFEVTDGFLEVVEYISYKEVVVRFMETGYTVTARKEAIEKGNVKDKLKCSVRGVGYLGVGSYIFYKDGKHTTMGRIWGSMLTRCYSEKYLETRPTYKDVTVCDEWHNFQNFCKWCEGRMEIDGYEDGYHLDKDILQPNSKGKIYSPHTCCFVSGVLNSKESSERCQSYKSVVRSPEGTSYNVYNQSDFCNGKGLNKTKFNVMILGKRKSHKGWTLVSTER